MYLVDGFVFLLTFKNRKRRTSAEHRTPLNWTGEGIMWLLIL